MDPSKERVLWVYFGHPVGIWERRLSALGNVDDSPFELIYHDCMMYVYRLLAFRFFIDCAGRMSDIRDELYSVPAYLCLGMDFDVAVPHLLCLLICCLLPFFFFSLLAFRAGPVNDSITTLDFLGAGCRYRV
ncbi:hypothetical protein BO85DRAFT_36621 [Aspergillus piperis CBS 112811]|uniref:Uncharacterized protein n=1 Tax=Aspergillus piperis CBS 112811 TaxID=1448313 RepID=A0A8G1R163_9EURO|nr:hypothetical protein BO85DRAFT_36621 [Aspergillus piperis CBS 112811]RAH57257.1 hypothetical protein BO85DRAFT_36621 [Aspergillus piperis CBS 112811]